MQVARARSLTIASMHTSGGQASIVSDGFRNVSHQEQTSIERVVMLVFNTGHAAEHSVSGVISVVNWTMAPDGQRYMFFWSPRWQVITDDQIPINNFRSSERWQLVAVTQTSEVLAVFPGCQVKAWIRCNVPPPVDCYQFKDDLHL